MKDNKKFENYVIVTDLDGTFLGKKSRIVPRNIERIKYFIENGGNFTIATGRIVSQVADTIPELCDIVTLPMITANGSLLYDVKKGEVMAKFPIPYELLRELSAFVHAYSETAGLRAGSVTYYLATERDMMSPKINRDLSGERIRKIAPLEAWRGEEVYKVAVREELDKIEDLRAQIKERFGETFEVTTSSNTLIEIIAKGRTKAVMIGEMTDICFEGKAGPKIFACGDYDNDIAMLTAADVAVCPSNASESVKAICDLCLCHHDEGLIGALIDEMDKGRFEAANLL